MCNCLLQCATALCLCFSLSLCLLNLSPQSFSSLHLSIPILSPPPSAHTPPFLTSPTFLFFSSYFHHVPTVLPPTPTTTPTTLIRVPVVARAAEVPLSQCAAGPTMKMCNVWHSWNESPNRRGSGYHRAPPGPGSVCLTLIMAHANECAPLKGRESCLPPCLSMHVVCQCVRVSVFVSVSMWIQQSACVGLCCLLWVCQLVWILGVGCMHVCAHCKHMANPFYLCTPA